MNAKIVCHDLYPEMSETRPNEGMNDVGEVTEDPFPRGLLHLPTVMASV